LLLIGLVLFVIGTLGGYLAISIEQLILARLVQAVGGCGGLVLGRAIVRDIYGRDRSASVIAYMTMAMVVAPMLAPLIGGYLSDWFGWRSTMLFTAAAGAVALACALPLIHETNHDPQPLPGIGGVAASYRSLLVVPAFRSYAFQTACSTAGFFAFLGGGPYLVIEIMDRSPSEYGLYFMMSAAGYMAGNFFSGRNSVRLGIDRMIGIGVTVSAVATIAMLALAGAGIMHPLAVFLPMTVYALGNGMSLPNGLAGAISINPRIAGAASGLSGFLQMGVGALASVLAGILVQQGALPMVAVMAVAAALAFYFGIGARRSPRGTTVTAEEAAE
ncbi:MAG TPA: MFS transporter, partial [Alphaproteobacteria bacterium]|nr:MFS transporter [Alphaproteobacteria bacterium]